MRWLLARNCWCRLASLGKDHPLTIAAKADLGALYGQMEKFEDARPLLQAACEFWSDRKPPAPLQQARALNDLAVVERGVGSFNDAKQHLDAALDLRRKNLDPNDTRMRNRVSTWPASCSIRRIMLNQ